jgi:putative ABC transport system ATP-binding protein
MNKNSNISSSTQSVTNGVESVVALSHLQVKLGGNQVLKDINLTLNDGDFLVVLGGNGSGKSTLLKCIGGILSAFKGSVSFYGKKIENANSLAIRKIHQNAADNLFLNMSVRENIMLYSMKIAHKLPFSLNDPNKLKAYLDGFNKKLYGKLDTSVKLLSGGEKQALILAMVLLVPPKLLLLDEHTSALDPKSAVRIMELTAEKVREYNVTCIMTTHSLEDALQYGNRLLALNNGQITFRADKKAKQQIKRDDILRECY